MYDNYLSTLEEVHKIGLTPDEASYLFYLGARGSWYLINDDRRAREFMYSVVDGYKHGVVLLDGFDGQAFADRLRSLSVRTQAALGTWALLACLGDEQRMRLAAMAEEDNRPLPVFSQKDSWQLMEALCHGDEEELTEWTTKGLEGLMDIHLGDLNDLFNKLDKYIETGITPANCTLFRLFMDLFRDTNADKF